jgi:hypothetical protein
LDENAYDKSKCKDAFEAYKKCKKEQVGSRVLHTVRMINCVDWFFSKMSGLTGLACLQFEADRQQRIASRKGFFG